MEWFVKALIKSSLAWLVAGVSMGVAIAVHPVWVVYRPAHFHMNLLGFVTMMISGVAYHVLPRFTGNVLHSRKLAAAHVWLANVGLALMVVGFVLIPQGVSFARWILGSGAVLSASALYLFAFNLWRTLDGRRAAGASAQVTPLIRKAAPFS